MSSQTRNVLFVTPFYVLFEYFLLKYIFLLIGNVDGAYLRILAILIGFIHFIPMLFESKKSTFFGRLLSAIDGVWMWASLMFLIDILVIYLIGRFIHLPYFAVLLILAIVPVLGIYNYHKAHKLVINEKTVKLNNISHDINIAHLSDVHFGSVRHKSIIRDVSAKLKELEHVCDIAIISGDLSDGSCAVGEDDFYELGSVSMPVVFTPGNHDSYLSLSDVVGACKKAGVIVLENESFEFKNLNIYGLPFSFEDDEVPPADELKKHVKDGKVNILNYHVPYKWSDFSSLGFDIQLSGHTHGGQFYPVVWMADVFFKYNRGLFKNNLGRYLHVTTGVGSTSPPMRWGTDSEIVILKLRK